MITFSNNVAMDITLTSLKPIAGGNKPHWISIGSVTAKNPNTQENFYFDFERGFGGTELLLDGRCEINYTKRDFDTDYFMSSNEHLETNAIDWSDIAQWQFEEIYITGDSVPTEFEDIHTEDFKVTDVTFYITNENDESLIYQLTEEQLAHLNEAVLKNELNDPVNNFSNDVEMEVTLTSKLPIAGGQKPNWIEVGGVTIFRPEDKESICFDFDDYVINATLLEDGRCKIECTKELFDASYFEEADGKPEMLLDWNTMQDWAFLNIDVAGVSVDGSHEDISAADFVFEHVLFHVVNKTGKNKTYEMTQAQLDYLNNTIMEA